MIITRTTLEFIGMMLNFTSDRIKMSALLLFGYLTGVAHDLMHFETCTHHHNITSHFDHQEQIGFRWAEDTED